MGEIEQMQVGDRVGIYRKSQLRHRGTLLAKVDANDESTWMGPEWILTIDVDGLGWRRWDEGRGEMFKARDLRQLGRVSIRKLD